MTDPYVVKCPACLAEPGERCTNRIRQLESVHWSRHRWPASAGPRAGVADQAGEHTEAHSHQLAATVRGGRGRSG